MFACSSNVLAATCKFHLFMGYAFTSSLGIQELAVVTQFLNKSLVTYPKIDELKLSQ